MNDTPTQDTPEAAAQRRQKLAATTTSTPVSAASTTAATPTAPSGTGSAGSSEAGSTTISTPAGTGPVTIMTTVKAAATEIAEFFTKTEAERFEPFKDVLKDTRTGATQVNHAFIPVPMLRALVEALAAKEDPANDDLIKSEFNQAAEASIASLVPFGCYRNIQGEVVRHQFSECMPEVMAFRAGWRRAVRKMRDAGEVVA